MRGAYDRGACVIAPRISVCDHLRAAGPAAQSPCLAGLCSCGEHDALTKGQSGSVVKRGNRGRPAGTTRRQRRFQGGFETKSAAREWVDRKVDEIAALRRGDLPRASDIPTVAELVDGFLCDPRGRPGDHRQAALRTRPRQAQVRRSSHRPAKPLELSRWRATLPARRGTSRSARSSRCSRRPSRWPARDEPLRPDSQQAGEARRGSGDSPVCATGTRSRRSPTNYTRAPGRTNLAGWHRAASRGAVGARAAGLRSPTGVSEHRAGLHAGAAQALQEVGSTTTAGSATSEGAGGARGDADATALRRAAVPEPEASHLKRQVPASALDTCGSRGRDRTPKRLRLSTHLRRLVDRGGGAAVLPQQDDGHLGRKDRRLLRAPGARQRCICSWPPRRVRRDRYFAG